MVDIDVAELNKKSLHPYMKVCADAGEFIQALNEHDDLMSNDYSDWVKTTKTWMKKYPSIKEEWRHNSTYVNSFCLMECISSMMSADDVYVGGRAGTCVDAAIQSFAVKKGQRVFVTKGLSSMGNGLPAAIGGAYATGCKIVCVNGDGGFVMNIQELAVVQRAKLPIKFFVLDNQGYSTVRGTQKNFFNGHFVGCSEESGLTLGNISKVAEAYGLKTYFIQSPAEMEATVAEALAYEGPCLVNVRVDPFQPIEPRQASYKMPNGQMASRPLEDMKPLLDRDELNSIMCISTKR
jgi:acetolactate synthase-1/2/3 large subunit